MKIGFIGLGIMGRPMALNLLRAGFPLCVWARRNESTAPLAQAGATVCRHAEDVARNSEIVLTCVSTDADLESIVFANNGLFGGLSRDSIFIDMSTVAPQTARTVGVRLEKIGVHAFDAPVSGGEKGAIDGTLSIMVGGPSDVFPRIEPILRALGKNIVYVGDHGAGQVAKACNQLLVAQTLTAIAEALTFSRANGVDPSKVRDALLGGFAASRALEVHGARMLAGDFKPGFKARLHQKDLDIVLHAAKNLGIALPGTALSAQLMNSLIGSGHGESDSAAILTILEKLTNVTLQQ